MKKYKVWIIVEATSKRNALARLDKAWFNLDPNLNFKVDEIKEKKKN